MINVAFVLYRQWGYDIFKNIVSNNSVKVKALVLSKDSSKQIKLDPKYKAKTYKIDPKDSDLLFKILKENDIRFVFFYSWSFILPKKIYKNFICLCIHPSPLPKYRGGTPIQNQLLANEKKSAVTVFKMDESVDGGDIYRQAPISLSGDINDIFERMVSVGTKITKNFIIDALRDNVKFKPQKNISKYSVNKRRTPSQSKINFDGLPKIKFEYLYNLVRGLLDPYPNAYVQTKDTKILIRRIKRSKTLPGAYFLLQKNLTLSSKKNLALKLKDGYALILDYRKEKT